MPRTSANTPPRRKDTQSTLKMMGPSSPSRAPSIPARPDNHITTNAIADSAANARAALPTREPRETTSLATWGLASTRWLLPAMADDPIMRSPLIVGKSRDRSTWLSGRGSNPNGPVPCSPRLSPPVPLTCTNGPSASHAVLADLPRSQPSRCHGRWSRVDRFSRSLLCRPGQHRRPGGPHGKPASRTALDRPRRRGAASGVVA
jgi:hypothetical protein